MIAFRCWYCGKRYLVAEDRIGERLKCSCLNLVKVPKKNHGYSRIKKPLDYFVELLVYGGGGALLGFGLFLLIVIRIPFLTRLSGRRWTACAILMLLGFLLGAFGGERGINWLGQKIREREQR